MTAPDLGYSFSTLYCANLQPPGDLQPGHLDAVGRHAPSSVLPEDIGRAGQHQLLEPQAVRN